MPDQNEPLIDFGMPKTGIDLIDNYFDNQADNEWNGWTKTKQESIANLLNEIIDFGMNND